MGEWAKWEMGIKKGICCDEHWVLHVSDESLNSTPDTNITLYVNLDFNEIKEGHLGVSVRGVSSFSSGHDLTVCEFLPRTGLWANGSEPVSDRLFPLPPPSRPFPTCSLSLSKINLK